MADIKTEPTYWNGEPTPCRRVRVMVADDNRFPSYWAREEGYVGREVDAVEVSYFDEPFYLLDDEGQGWRKVTVGHGSPNFGHRNITPESPPAPRAHEENTRG